MPLFAWIGWDGPRGAELRKLERPAHLARLEALAAAGRVRHAGPLLDAAGHPIGSLVLFAAESLEAARELAAADPYARGGVFAHWRVHETRAVFPKDSKS